MSAAETTENADPTVALTADPAITETATVAKKTALPDCDANGGATNPNRRKTQVASIATPAMKRIVASKINHEYVDVQ